jgi:hypothetical protein
MFCTDIGRFYQTFFEQTTVWAKCECVAVRPPLKTEIGLLLSKFDLSNGFDNFLFNQTLFDKSDDSVNILQKNINQMTVYRYLASVIGDVRTTS